MIWNQIKHILICILLCNGAAAQAVSPADPAKIIHMAFEGEPDGFDMVRTSNGYSVWISEAIFETMLTYDYMARPAKVVPSTVDAMPEISDGGKTYVFHIRKGIYFTPDPAFKGIRRELTAQDYAYSIKRLLDPANRSPSAYFVEGKIAGLDALAEKSKKTGHFDYDAPVAGLQVPDRYTLRIQLNAPDYNFLYIVAYSGLAAVAREVIEAYGQQSGQHPVGTGAYMLAQHIPNSKIVLVANPDYRGFTWNFKSSGDAWDDQMVRDMQGKKMPQVGRIEINIIQEEQSRWLAFQDKQIDLMFLPQLAAPEAMDGNKLKPVFSKQGIQLYRLIEPTITYTFFNFKDPVVGGYSKEKDALRRAIAMSYNTKDEIALVRFGQANKAEMMIPPGVAGYDPAYRNSIAYDPALANKLLDYFGYKRGSDGYRTLPDGKPLVLKIHREARAIDQELAELWKRSLDQIGIKAEFPISKFSENLKAAKDCKLMMWGGSWSADFPDAENFLQLLYGPNARLSNHSCYQSPAYDALYDQLKVLPPGPERDRLVREMNRQMEADTAWVLNVVKVRNWVARPWVKGFKKHPILLADWQYLDMEK
jgi:ABC-type transport system substrate-binding protein